MYTLQSEMTEFMQHIPLIFVLYDSDSSLNVLEQIMTPLLEHKAKNPGRIIHLVIFTNKNIPAPTIPRIAVHIEQQSRFLQCSARSLKAFLSLFPQYELRAYEAFAGYICVHARNKNCAQLTIQIGARVSQLYQQKCLYHTWITRWFYRWYANRLEKIEKWVYTTPGIKIETNDNKILHYLTATCFIPKSQINQSEYQYE